MANREKRSRLDLGSLDPALQHQLMRAALWNRRISIQCLLPLMVLLLIVALVVVVLHDQHPHATIIGVNIIIVACTVMLTLYVRRKGRETALHELERLGFCAYCGYDLRQSIADGRDVCPECGEAIPLRDADGKPEKE